MHCSALRRGGRQAHLQTGLCSPPAADASLALSLLLGTPSPPPQPQAARAERRARGMLMPPPTGAQLVVSAPVFSGSPPRVGRGSLAVQQECSGRSVLAAAGVADPQAAPPSKG